MPSTPTVAARTPLRETDWPHLGLMLAVHGIRGGPGSAPDHAESLTKRGLFAEVHVGVHKGSPDLIGVARSMIALRPLVVVPLLMAEGYTHRVIRMRLEAAFEPGVRAHLARPIGLHPRFADLVLNEALGGCSHRGWQPEATGLLLVGHGTRRDPTSGGTTRRHASAALAAKHFAEIGIAFLDEPPSVPEALARFTASNVIVVGLFLDRGEHGEEDLPELLQPFAARTQYTGPVGLDPLVPDLVLDQLRSLAGSAAA